MGWVMLSKVNVTFNIWSHNDRAGSRLFSPVHQRRRFLVLRLLFAFSEVSELRQKDRGGCLASSKLTSSPCISRHVTIPKCFIMGSLLLFRYGESHRSGDDSHWKNRVVVPKQSVPGHTVQGHTEKPQGPSGGREGEGKCEGEVYCRLRRKKQVREAKQA